MTFWIFGYGSLMADGWERAFGCVSRSTAVLRDHVRSFDKASIESRGTREHPAPTLRVSEGKGECEGVAFQFDDNQRQPVEAYLTEREGKAFPLRQKMIDFNDGSSTPALVPMYEGRRIIKYGNLNELAEMAMRAQGTRGNGVDYVRDIAKHLESLGIRDQAVADFLNVIDSCQQNAAAKR